VLVIWAIDRFGRSMAGNLADVTELDRVGVSVVSVRESWLDTFGPTRPLLLAIFSWVAEQEHARIVERIDAGLATARRKGKRLGRKPTRVDLDEVTRHREGGLSVRATAEAMGLNLSTLQRALDRAVEGDPKPPRSAARGEA
jgi:DNA invertase Pin-like site-specific DNA recombinase